MSSPEIELKDSDFSVTRSRLARFNHRMLELPSKLRLAAQGAWRGKERGLAVITGVFLFLSYHNCTRIWCGIVPIILRGISQIRTF